MIVEECLKIIHFFHFSFNKQSDCYIDHYENGQKELKDHNPTLMHALSLRCFHTILLDLQESNRPFTYVYVSQKYDRNNHLKGGKNNIISTCSELDH